MDAFLNMLADTFGSALGFAILLVAPIGAAVVADKVRNPAVRPWLLMPLLAVTGIELLLVVALMLFGMLGWMPLLIWKTFTG